MIELRAPADLRVSGSGSIWAGSSWVDLDIDRVDFTVNNDVKIYELIDAETKLDQFKSSTHQMILTGHITVDSELIGSDLFTKMKNLIYAGRQWYIDLQATNMTSGDCGYPQVKWNDHTWNCMIQKIAIIDDSTAGDTIINYQLGLILGHNEDD